MLLVLIVRKTFCTIYETLFFHLISVFVYWIVLVYWIVGSYSARLVHCINIAFSCISVAVFFAPGRMIVAPFQLPAR